MRKIICFLPLFLMFLLMYSTAIATPLYIHDSRGELGTYDIATDTTTDIGNMGVVMTDIAFDPSGNLFGISFSGLYSIDSANANATFIGNHGISGGNALVFGSDGTLYGAGSTTENLYSINTSTGAGSVLGNMGFYSSGDLAFNNGEFYLAADTSTTDTLVRINQITYAGTAVGSIGYDNVYGLATGDGGVLYGVSGTSVFSIDPTTGASTYINSYDTLGASYGSSFINESQPPVPEPATLLLLGAGLAGLAGFKSKLKKA